MKQTDSDLQLDVDLQKEFCALQSRMFDLLFDRLDAGITFPLLLPCSIPEISPYLPRKFSNNARLQIGRYI